MIADDLKFKKYQEVTVERRDHPDYAKNLQRTFRLIRETQDRWPNGFRVSVPQGSAMVVWVEFDQQTKYTEKKTGPWKAPVPLHQLYADFLSELHGQCQLLIDKSKVYY